ncbi:RNA-directed DNA polymerase from mobile element jockey [Eumeta japonica]|uniref:RNA-directed DNA polymerase from mobile element jockey n=1 Tax=Eumeta variegata TaxID=151549 RepID=A0A4C1T8Y7_EUMVA|nr:RNA-directed DNA polymerase from mobile element jockey [Eumeta japonica]
MGIIESDVARPTTKEAGYALKSLLGGCAGVCFARERPGDTMSAPTTGLGGGRRTALYADDSTYFASSRRADLAAAKIQRVLDLLPEWLDKWRVAVNVTKTAALLTGQQRTMPPKLRLRGQDVEWQTKVRYLGVQIDRTMRMPLKWNKLSTREPARSMRAQLPIAPPKPARL